MTGSDIGYEKRSVTSPSIDFSMFWDFHGVKAAAGVELPMIRFQIEWNAP